jgi:hypothetical protein
LVANPDAPGRPHRSVLALDGRMNPPLSLIGKNANRLGWTLVIASLGALPLHFFISPHQSGAVAAFALFVFFADLVLGLLQPRSPSSRWLPALCAFGLFLVHGIFPCL